MDYLINLPIYTTNRGKAKVSTREGKESQTLVNTLEKFKHFTLVECKPHTGRMHQIRVHLAAVDSPVVADVLYGANIPFLSEIKKKFNLARDKEERPMIERLALHAKELSFKLGKPYRLEAPYPRDFEALLNVIRKYDSI
jgi:23S rRNA pseudouridine955/2504/2580 synthase